MEYYGRYDNNYVQIAKRQQKFPCTKIECLDRNEFVVFEITDDIVADTDKLTITYNQGVQGKLSFDIDNSNNKYTINEDSPFWFQKKIRFYKGLKDAAFNNFATENTYWFSMGVFVICGVTANDEDKTISVSCVDKFGLFTSDTGYSLFDKSAKIEAGVKIKSCIEDILSKGVESSTVLDPISPIIDTTLWGNEIGQDIEIASGNYLGDVLVDLATTVKARIYYDENGRLRLDNGTSDYNFSMKAPIWTFNYEDTTDYFRSSLDYDYSNVINKITVSGEDFDGQVYTYTAVNDNPKSPTRISKIGYKVGKTRENMYGYKQQNVESFAKYYLNLKSIQGLAVSLSCSYLPHLKVGDVVILNNQQYDFDGKRLMIEEISFNGTDMSIKVVNLDSLPYYSKEIE